MNAIFSVMLLYASEQMTPIAPAGQPRYILYIGSSCSFERALVTDKKRRLRRRLMPSSSVFDGVYIPLLAISVWPTDCLYDRVIVMLCSTASQ